MRIQGQGYFEKVDKEQIESKITQKVDNLYKKVQFY